MKYNRRKHKDAIYAQLARIGKAVASPRRLELLDLLSQCPRTVEALAQEAGLGIANASQHLKALRAAELVTAEKQGLYVTYRLASQQVADFFRTIRLLGESRLAEIERLRRDFFHSPDDLERVTRRSLLDRVRRGDVTVLDVRPPEEFRAGHIPGALSIPLEELERRLSELSPDEDIAAYCRGPYCLLAVEAVRILRERGYRAFRLEEGVPDWRARGLEVDAVEVSP